MARPAQHTKVQTMSARMLAGFALYPEQPLPPRNCIVGMPIGARALRLVRLIDGWRLWLSTRDYKHGTYVDMHDDGSVWNITTRADEGDECWLARPSDAEIRSML